MPDKMTENAAADVVAHQMDAQVVRRDCPGAPDGTHDFDLLYTNGKVAALEITTAASELILKRWHSMSNINHRFVAKSLRSTWMLMLRGGNPQVNLKKIVSEAPRLLERLEVSDISGFERTSPDEIVVHGSADKGDNEAVDRLRALGVTSCSAIGHPEQGSDASILLAGAGGYSGSIRRESINGVIEHAICANQKKLERAAADERHVFVWIDPSIGAAGVSIDGSQPPATGPNLPEPVTTVWAGFAALGGPCAGVQSLWRADRGRRWEHLGSVSLP